MICGKKMVLYIYVYYENRKYQSGEKIGIFIKVIIKVIHFKKILFYLFLYFQIVFVYKNIFILISIIFPNSLGYLNDTSYLL